MHPQNTCRTGGAAALCEYAKYKRPCSVNPTVFVNMESEWAAENEATNLLTTFTEEVAALARKQAMLAPAQAAPVHTGANLLRNEYLFKPGDLGFITGGLITLDDGREIADGEDFWAFQVSKPFERSRMRNGCSVDVFWLQRAGRSNKPPSQQCCQSPLCTAAQGGR
jgi:hypothetical protein